jgi:hypothetical protein
MTEAEMRVAALHVPEGNSNYPLKEPWQDELHKIEFANPDWDALRFLRENMDFLLS